MTFIFLYFVLRFDFKKKQLEVEETKLEVEKRKLELNEEAEVQGEEKV